MSIYKELNDKKWLNEHYNENLRSCLNISKELGCNNNSVRQALIKHGIKVRTPSEAQIVDREFNLKIDSSVLDGSLMGDAFLTKWRKGVKSLPKLQKNNKHLDHLTWFAEHFEPIPNIKLRNDSWRKSGKEFTAYEYRTGVDKRLQDYYERWYPESNDYVKVIPDDLVIDPVFLLHWFLDDGFTHTRDRSSEYKAIGKGWTQKVKQITLGLCTECFDLKSQQKLSDKVNERYDLDMTPRKVVWKNSKEKMEGYRLFISQLKVDKFFEIVGECPFESLKYKWK